MAVTFNVWFHYSIAEFGYIFLQSKANMNSSSLVSGILWLYFQLHMWSIIVTKKILIMICCNCPKLNTAPQCLLVTRIDQRIIFIWLLCEWSYHGNIYCLLPVGLRGHLLGFWTVPQDDLLFHFRVSWFNHRWCKTQSCATRWDQNGKSVSLKEIAKWIGRCHWCFIYYLGAIHK